MNKFAHRKKYFIHHSSQFKYIGMTILPALLMCVFCTYFLIYSGEIFLSREKNQVGSEVASIGATVRQLKSDNYPPEAIGKVEVLQKQLINLAENLEIEYFKTMEKWAKTKMSIIFLLSVVMVLAGTMALLFSHRVAGPLLRLTKSLDMLSQGKDIPPFHFRSYDEFKELAAAFDRLRKTLKDKGILSA
jgi:nitrate/nitrite-specific signal transduction histidine kinase